MLKNIITFFVFIISLSSYSQFTRLRISDNIGYGFRNGILESDVLNIESTYDGLDFGFVYEIELGYDVNDVWGVGLHFSNFHSSDKAEINGGVLDEDFDGESVLSSSNLRLSYLAPKLYFLVTEEGSRDQLMIGASIGYARYENNIYYQNSTKRIVANAFGLGFNGEYDYVLTPFFSLTSRLNAILAFVSKYRLNDFMGNRTVSVEDLNNDNSKRQRVSVLSLTVGLRVNISRSNARNKKIL